MPPASTIAEAEVSLKRLLAFAGAFLGGLAVGLLIAERPAENPPATTTPAPADSATASARPRARSGAGGDAVVRDVAVPAPRTGDGTITGVVRTAAGAPLAGVLVRAAPERDDDAAADPSGGPPGSPPARADVEREVRRLVARLRRSESEIRESTTDAAGAFAVTGLAKTDYEVHAWLSGWRIDKVRWSEGKTFAPGGRCDFVATPVRLLTVSVLLPDGTSPTRASVAWKPADGGDGGESDWRPESPQIDLPDGTYELSASTAPVHVEDAWHRTPLYRCEPQTVVIAKDLPQSATLTLDARPGIDVRVVFESARRPPHVRVAALRLDDGAPADPARLLGPSAKQVWLEEELQGAFIDVEPGTYLVGVTFRGGAIGPTASVSVGSGLVEQELRVPAGEIRDWVKAWVRAPDGGLVRDAKIECGCRIGDRDGDESTDVSADADGAYHVPHFEGGAPMLGGARSGGDLRGDGPRTYFVRAASDRYGEVETTYDPATQPEITLQFAAPAMVRATIAGYAASPDRRRVRMELSRKEGYFSVSAKIDAAGTATFPGVQPGEYELELLLADRDERRRDGDARRMSKIDCALHAGDNSFTVALREFIDLVVTFDLPLRDVALQRYDKDGRIETVDRDRPRDGEREVAFLDLTMVPGRYRIAASQVGDMWIDLPGPRRVAFKPRPFNAFHVRPDDDGKGYLSSVGLQYGDVVVAVDGATIEGQGQIDALYAAMNTGAPATLTIRRGAAQFDVAVETKRLQDGGRLAPWVR
jgi:hypothetical protein